MVDISNKKVQFSVEDSTFISADQGKCSNDSINSIKKYLVSNGAISANMYFESSTTNMKLDGTKIIDDFINGPYYYYDGSSYKRQLSYSSIEIAKNKSSNHGITIIGWDDTIDASNFSKTPSRNGAWIIKNSYGETLKTTSGDIDMGDKGYYYVSYDDINICTQLSGFYDISSELEDNSYYYDKLGLIGAINVKNSDLYLANIFEKKSSFSEKLKKVTFFSGSIDQKYDIYFSDDGNLKNMTKIYSGVSDKIGYTTIGIDDVTIANEKYAIAVKFYGNVSNNIYVYAKQSKIYTMDVPNNVSYMSDDGVNWENFGTTDDNYLSSIRSYTNNLNYTFSLESSSIIDDSLNTKFKYDGINNLSDVKYNIYNVSDTSFSTSLNDNFDIDNMLDDDKTINLSINDNSSIGNYILVVSYKDVNIKIKFNVIQNQEELSIELAKEENNSNGPQLIVDDNPKNDIINDGSVVDDENITNNPKTSGVNIIIVAIILSVLVISFIIYNIYNSRKKNNI